MEVVDLPEPAGDGVVIEVAAAGICFPDVLLPDLVVCRPELAEPILDFVRRHGVD